MIWANPQTLKGHCMVTYFIVDSVSVYYKFGGAVTNYSLQHVMYSSKLVNYLYLL